MTRSVDCAELWINKCCSIVDKISVPFHVIDKGWKPIDIRFFNPSNNGTFLLLLDLDRWRAYRVMINTSSTLGAIDPPQFLLMLEFSKEVWQDILTHKDKLNTEVPTIDQEARKIIYGDREQTYGHPSKNLQLIAEFWTSYLKGKEVLTCDDVCNMMILMKTARLKNTPDHRDSLVDIIGYTMLKERCKEPQGEKNE